MAMKSKDLYPGIFSRHAAEYEKRLEQVMTRGEAKGRARVIEVVEAKPGMRILDLACGPGNLSRRLAPMVSPDGEVVGVDLAPGMIERARAADTPNSRFEVMDIEALEFADGSFDGAVCGHGLQFAPHLDRAFTEARRVLRHGARFVASVPGGDSDQSAMRVLESVIDRWLPPAPRADDQGATRAIVGSPDSFAAAATAAGFAEANVEVLEETTRWESVDELVGLFSSWWVCASRLEGVDPKRREAFLDDAVTTLRKDHPGPLVTVGRNYVLAAIAP